MAAVIVSALMTPVDALLARAMEAWRPPPRLRLSEWADQHFYLSAESAAEPGRWRTLPYQRGIMDAITDPEVTQVSVMKSARIGYTKCINAAVGYYMHQDPCPIMVVQPTIEDAQGYSKEEIAPMLRDCPTLAAIVPEPKTRDSDNTILLKRFPAARCRSSAPTARAASAACRARSSSSTRPTAIRRAPAPRATRFSSAFAAPSTTGTARSSSAARRRSPASAASSGCSRRRPAAVLRAVPALRRHAGPAFPQFPGRKASRSSRVRVSGVRSRDRAPAQARDGQAGEWRRSARAVPGLPAPAPFNGHASFHIWAAYSFSPNASWGQLCTEFVARERGRAPEDLRQHRARRDRGRNAARRRSGSACTSDANVPDRQLPAGVLFLTAGVDVQKDRLVYEVVGWGRDKRSWSIDAGAARRHLRHDAERILAGARGAARAAFRTRRLDCRSRCWRR
jgi:hypothetical protein